jgi:hypothetical protein
MNRPLAVVSVDGERRAHVCAWCEDKTLADLWCKEQNLSVTHGICPDCQERFMPENELLEPA